MGSAPSNVTRLRPRWNVNAAHGDVDDGDSPHPPSSSRPRPHPFEYAITRRGQETERVELRVSEHLLQAFDRMVGAEGVYRGRSEAIRAAMAFLLEHQVERMPADVQREVHKVLSSIRQEARVARREALAHAVEAAVRMVDTMIRDREWNELTEWVVGDGRALSLVLEGEKRARIDGVIETATRWLGTAGTTEE